MAAFRLFVSALRRPLACLHRLVTVVAFVSTLLVIGAARADAQEVIEYYGTDAVGSIRVVFAPNGTVKARSDYLPFGEEWQPATPGGPLPTQRFTGQQRDAEENLDYFNARSLQARTGRFTAVDPVFTGLFNPQAWNRYSYALNSPLRFSDPTGLFPIEHRDPPGPVGGRGDGGYNGGGGLENGGSGYCQPACDFPTDPPAGTSPSPPTTPVDPNAGGNPGGQTNPGGGTTPKCPGDPNCPVITVVGPGGPPVVTTEGDRKKALELQKLILASYFGGKGLGALWRYFVPLAPLAADPKIAKTIADTILTNPNKLNHIFSAAHGLERFTMTKPELVRAVANEVARLHQNNALVLGPNGVLQNTTVVVQGQTVNVTGRIMNGIPVVSNFW